ncbi:hypothetical protein AB0O74_34765 [Streptomyces rubiginosohelvolus]|uniref:hypothetical protein n=1 Tax=Streptomyces rubiginosohelvolus TaxID=67362 RepID=UPI003431FDEE
MLTFRIDQTDHYGTRRLPLSTRSCPYTDAEVAALVDDLADGGTELVKATALLADELVQAFGIPEAAFAARAAAASTGRHDLS